jgi:hypothetical protein
VDSIRRRIELFLAEVIEVYPLNLIVRYGGNTDIVVNHELSQLFSIDKDNLVVNSRCIVLSFPRKAGSGDENALLRSCPCTKELGADPETLPRVKELRAKLAEAVDITALENEVYSHLYNFFRRYYQEGDFILLRRYEEGVYAIPYEGEEVKLHWANHDQYYILRDWILVL